jgi:deoxyribonuclease V
VEAKHLHGWQVDPRQAGEIQRRLAAQVSRRNEVTGPRLIAGVDISLGAGGGTGAVVVLSYPELEVVETEVAQGRLSFAYIPGLLSFRESPLILAACERLTLTPDLILVDGQGVAHPRRMGLASHLGLLLDRPTIGCAKSILCGSWAELKDGDETVGAALRSRAGASPIYISIGHKIDLETAIYWAKECCRGYRLPEPSRVAHLAAGGKLKPGLAAEIGH